MRPVNTMNKISFQFDLRAVSFQQQQFVKYKTPLQMTFQKLVLFELMKHKESMALFKNSFDPKTHVIESQWAFLYTDFFTKKENTVSSKCLDLDNSTKNIQDLIFKHGLEMDDKNIVKMKSFKWQADKDSIILMLKLVERKEIVKDLEEMLSSLFT